LAGEFPDQAWCATEVLLQVLRNGRKLLECGLQIGGDVGSDDFRRRQVRGLLERVVFQPEDVQVHLVALGQLFVGEGLEALALLPITPLPLCPK